ncbi:hypothetical protein Celaphus_00015958 [Cervus elaphus hippelaphus]|uniref:Uncharacterized protein n=1 Tax=Cervus elaphus hippelaphus TaxID=46360 RepID=A0A212C1R1_CEREH|nr:hypothetical protein Celaphus_00015958 [Cervus elaphus hippelaphus]
MSLIAQRATDVGCMELWVYSLTEKHLIFSCLMGDIVFSSGLAGALASNPASVVRTHTMNWSPSGWQTPWFHRHSALLVIDMEE